MTETMQRETVAASVVVNHWGGDEDSRREALAVLAVAALARALGGLPVPSRTARRRWLRRNSSATFQSARGGKTRFGRIALDIFGAYRA